MAPPRPPPRRPYRARRAGRTLYFADDGSDLVLAGLRGPALDTFTRSDLGHDPTPSILYATVRHAVAASGLRAEPVGQGEDAGA